MVSTYNIEIISENIIGFFEKKYHIDGIRKLELLFSHFSRKFTNDKDLLTKNKLKNGDKVWYTSADKYIVSCCL